MTPGAEPGGWDLDPVPLSAAQVEWRALGAGSLVVNAAYALLLVALVTEVAWLLLRDGRSRLAPVSGAAVMGGVAACTGVGVAAVHLWAWRHLGTLAPDGLARFWRANPLLAGVVAFVMWDAAGYWYHRIGHRTRVGWASHQVHHSGRDYDLTLALRQPWLPVHALAVYPLVALGGFGVGTALVCAALSNLYQALLHTSWPVRFPVWAAAWVQAPHTHRRHHLAEGPAVNLGPVLTVWDRMFGTWDPTPVSPGSRYGLDGQESENPLRTQFAGWRSLVARRERTEPGPAVR